LTVALPLAVAAQTPATGDLDGRRLAVDPAVLAAGLSVALTAYGLYRHRLRQIVEIERIRTRIATDLHDDIGASLSQIAILSEVVCRQVGDDPELTSRLARMAEVSRELVDSMNDIVWSINPRRDRLDDLLHRMRRFAADSLAAGDVALSFRGDTAGHVSVGPELRRQVYLVFKESVTNAIRHSGATRVDVDVRVLPDRLVVRVSDDGSGLDPAATADGHGLLSMKSRAGALGGSLEISSVAGSGTMVRLQVPLPRRGRAASSPSPFRSAPDRNPRLIPSRV
jgi:signal transduction histidine kinase